jgi:hypothetical protein
MTSKVTFSVTLATVKIKKGRWTKVKIGTGGIVVSM